jgi:hypothetical protein
LVIALTFSLVLTAYADRTRLSPGWNLFSPEQDVEMGREVAAEAERELPILNNRDATAYINALGRQLASKAGGPGYPYQFKIVNDKTINAFALPGGFIYINRGIIEQADNEAQLAGVVAHEIAHVALRHGTSQASKAYLAQVPLSILGGVVGGNSVGAVIAQLGIGFAANSVLLKYSRDAERQADLLGTQILYDSRYDPQAMVQFFQKLESRGGTEFFSSHPNPGNRIQNVDNEIRNLGSAPGTRSDSADFRQVKAMLGSVPAATRRAAADRDTRNGNGRPAAPSTRMVNYDSRYFSFSHPENWRVFGQGSAITVAPDGGIVNNGLAYGMMISTFEPRYDRYGEISLEEATDQLLDDLRQSNPGMRLPRTHDRLWVDGQRALLTEATNESPAGGREVNWIVTVLDRDDQLYYIVGVAPQGDFNRYERTFDRVIDSVRF